MLVIGGGLGLDNKEKNLRDIVNCGVVAIIRVASAQEAVEV